MSEHSNANFNDFISNWRAERIDSLFDDGVAIADRDILLQRRTMELLELALRHGYRVELAEAVGPYRDTTKFVAAMFSASEARRKSP